MFANTDPFTDPLPLPAYRLPLGFERRRGYRSRFWFDHGHHVLDFYVVRGHRLAIPYCRRCGERRDVGSSCRDD